MNNTIEISHEITNIEKSIKNMKGLLQWDNELPEDERKKIFAHLNHLVKQVNSIKSIVSAEE